MIAKIRYSLYVLTDSTEMDQLYVFKNFDLYLLIVMDIVSFSEREYFFLGMTKYLSISLRHAVAFVLVTINQKSSTYMYNSLINVTRIYVLIRLDIMK